MKSFLKKSLALFAVMLSSNAMANICDDNVTDYLSLYEECKNTNMEFYEKINSTALYRRCRYHTEALVKKIGRGENFHISDEDTKEIINGEKKELRKLIVNYSKHCLPEPQDSAGVKFENFIRKIRERTVIILKKERDGRLFPKCTGFIRDESLFTARHCFHAENVTKKVHQLEIEGKLCDAVKIENPGNYLYYKYGKNVGEGRFITIKEKQNKVPEIYKEKEELFCLGSNILALDFPGLLETTPDSRALKKIFSSDWINLKLNEELEIEFFPENLVQEEINSEKTKFLITGFSKAKFIEKSIYLEGEDISLILENSLYFDMNDVMCRPFHKDGNIFHHGCHTLTIGSGSPIIALRYIEDYREEIKKWLYIGMNAGYHAFTALCSKENTGTFIAESEWAFNSGISILNFDWESNNNKYCLK